MLTSGIYRQNNCLLNVKKTYIGSYGNNLLVISNDK